MARRVYRFSLVRSFHAPPGPQGARRAPPEFAFARLTLGALLMGLGGLGVWLDMKYVDPPGRRMSLASMCLFFPSAFLSMIGLGLAWSAWAEAKLHRMAKRLRGRGASDAGRHGDRERPD